MSVFIIIQIIIYKTYKQESYKSYIEEYIEKVYIEYI